jgi:hypothetical protein
MEWLMGFGSRQLVKNRNSTNYDSDAFSWCYCLWVLKKYVSGTTFSAVSGTARFFFSLFD